MCWTASSASGGWCTERSRCRAAATIVSRSPVYAAIWFALSLVGVAGVLLVLGAQFLGVATIVVYAGAILVMFLFVLMLAQPAGLAPYDRVSNEPFLSALAGAVLLGVLSLSIGRLSVAPSACCGLPSRAKAGADAAKAADHASQPQVAVAAGVPGMSASEVRGLGRQGSQVHLHTGNGLRLDFLRKVRVEIVLDDHQEAEVLRLIQEVNRTGRIGDGKVFTGSLDTALRIRTAERGLLAI